MTRPYGGAPEPAAAACEQDPRGDEAAWVRLAIPVATLEQLITTRALCAADVRCLDTDSRNTLKRLCLERCGRCLRATPSLCGKLLHFERLLARYVEGR